MWSYCPRSVGQTRQYDLLHSRDGASKADLACTADIFAVWNCWYFNLALQLTLVCNSHVMLLSPSFCQRFGAINKYEILTSAFRMATMFCKVRVANSFIAYFQRIKYNPVISICQNKKDNKYTKFLVWD